MKVELRVGSAQGSKNSGNAQEEPENYHDHEIKEAADTLVKAEHIKQKPNLMVHVRKHLDQKMGAIKSIKQLKDKYKKLTSANEEGSAQKPDSDGDYDGD